MAKGNVARAVSGAGSRIHEEIKEREISVRQFQDRMKKRNVRGSAYSTIWNYLKDRVEPDLGFVQAAAEELGVREAYLLKGELPKTEAAQRVTLQEQLRPGSPWVDGALESLGWSPGPRALFHEAWRRYAAGAKGKKPPSDQGLIDLGATLLMVVQVPSKLWGFKHEMSGHQADDFAVAMLGALMLAMPDRGKGDRVSDRGRRYPKSPPGIKWSSDDAPAKKTKKSKRIRKTKTTKEGDNG